MGRTWSVEAKANSWNDDLFNGSYKECVKYCEDHDYAVDGENVRLAEIEVDEKGRVIGVYCIVSEV